MDPVILAMVSAFHALDHAADDEIDPDFAVQVQHVMGDCLHELSEDDVPEFRGILLRLARDRDREDPHIAAYLRRIADGYAVREV